MTGPRSAAATSAAFAARMASVRPMSRAAIASSAAFFTSGDAEASAGAASRAARRMSMVSFMLSPFR